MSLLLKSVGDRLLDIYYSVHTQTTKHAVVVSLSLSDKPIWHDTKTDNLKKLAKKDESATKQWKQIMLEVELESAINVVTEERADHGNIDTASIWEPLDIQSEELSKGQILIINEESSWDQKHEDLPEELTLAKNLRLRDLSGIFLNIESIKDKMLPVDSKLEWSTTICQDTEKITCSIL